MREQNSSRSKLLKEINCAIKEYNYQRYLLRSISRVSDFDNVPEILYYEAVVARKYISGDSILVGVLDKFIRMCNVHKLTDVKMPDLMHMKIRPKNAVVSRNNADITKSIEVYYRMYGYVWLQIPVSLVIYLVIVQFLPSIYECIVVLFMVIVYTILSMLLTPDFLISILEDYINKHGEGSTITVDSIDCRTRQFLRELPREYKSLAKKFLSTHRYTCEYYNTCADIELEYIKYKKGGIFFD